MRLELSEEQLKLRALVREFAEREIAPVAEEIDKEGKFPFEVIKKAAKLGLLGITIPKEYGGLGLDNISYTLALEEISKVSSSLGLTIEAHNSLGLGHIYNKGTEAQRRKYVIPLAKGEYLGAWALTEPLAGSDATSIQTTAVRENDYWVLNGTKLFTTSGDIAGTIVIMAVTDKAKGAKGISAFIVEKGTEGLSYGREEDKLGLRARRTVELILENCKIPKENLLGEEGLGFIGAMDTLSGGRFAIAAMAVGIAQAAFEEALRYSKQRKQFGKFICEFQATQWLLANLATEIEASRLLAYKAALAKDKGERFTYEASMAKLFASEVAVRIAIKAVQIHGGYGYTKDYPVERYFRDAKITEIYECTNEIQRLVIASHLLGK